MSGGRYTHTHTLMNLNLLGPGSAPPKEGFSESDHYLLVYWQWTPWTWFQYKGHLQIARNRHRTGDVWTDRKENTDPRASLCSPPGSESGRGSSRGLCLSRRDTPFLISFL